MVSQQGWVVALAVISLFTGVGWSWFSINHRAWPALEREWVGRTVQVIYFVGIPYLAMVLGLLPPRLLGLRGVEHFALIDFQAKAIAAQLFYASVLTLLDWFVDIGMSVVAGLAALAILGGVWFSLTRIFTGRVTGFRVSGLDTIFHSLHWAFYWAIFWLLTRDLYLGVVLGTGLVLFEWGLMVRVQKKWQPQQWSLSINIIILILSGTVFFYSPNLWLLWPIQLLMIILVTKLDLTRRSEQPLEAEHLFSFPYIP